MANPTPDCILTFGSRQFAIPAVITFIFWSNHEYATLKLVFTGLLDSLVPGGYNGTNAIADGYVKVIPAGNSGRINIQIDTDGALGAATFRQFIAVQLNGGGDLSVPSNFLF